ncbi:uncharacterized protein C9orf40 homolog [Hemiscyllium ocellatum]|uniref:uncharacterized protein C9orf40 homolog n=1 Tax=Hemiscyllium ocellatum TaxID=170820 RepID=UPI0029667E26|nr:uncharacterized protein C9orf40 homolog [Hemiscyllium ocellatum]XP_060701014.1 uncharacterized protein C9orf40 homolog [Hemiscyllium ocellatum]
MSKRKAEETLCCRPGKRFVSLPLDRKRSVRPPAPSAQASAKRKLREEPLQEPECKRPGSARPGHADGGSTVGARREAGAGDGDRGSASSGAGEWPARASRLSGAAQNAPGDEVSCQYNSFQFWRVQLPPVDLTEIEDFRQPKIIEEMNCEDPDESAEIEMELHI